MKAVARDRYGSSDLVQVQDLDRPPVAPGEVLVRVEAAALDRGVWHLMTGRPYLLRLFGFGLRRPKAVTLGSDLAGVIEVVGAEVIGFAPGDAVFGVGTGSFAEYAVARPDQLVGRPANLTAEQAAAVPVSGSTALQALRHGKVQAGERVLIIGASGGVGTFAVQLAAAFGAEVTGVCSTGKLDAVRSAGAAHVIDYSTTADLGEGGQRYDLVLDIGGSRPISVLRRLLTPRGRLVIVGGEGGGDWIGMGRQLRAMALSPFVSQRLGTFVAGQNRADLETLRTMIEEGTVTPVIDRVCSLADVAAAIADLEAGRICGKVVISNATP